MTAAEFTGQDLAGSQFEQVRLADARFRRVDLSGARFNDVLLTGAVIRGAYAESLEVEGEFGRLTVNGIDVTAYVQEELNRRHPDLARMSPEDAAGYRDAWAIVEDQWAATVARAKTMDPQLLHERVDGEWSFIQTLRHLVFATDAWISRAMLGDPRPWSPLGLPHEEMDDLPGIPRDREARPSLEEVLVLRADRMATVRRVIGELTDEQLASSTEPVIEPGYPESVSFPVRRCLRAVVLEEWWHRRFAERDLDVLESRTG